MRSVPSPSHPAAREDVGTVAARAQDAESRARRLSGRATGRDDDVDGSLVDRLCPFQLMYEDGVERVAAESARERVRWVSAIW